MARTRTSLIILAFVLHRAIAQWIVEDDDSDECQTPFKEAGTCVAFKECKYLNDILESADGYPTRISPQLQELIRSHRCGFMRDKPKVCCPLKTPTIDLHSREPPPPPDVSRHRNYKLLPRDCGFLDTSDRIVNGNKTALFEFPWMALLSYRTRNGPDFQCGGTIIDSRHILTAAHCLHQVASPLIGIRIGEYDLDRNPDCDIIDDENVCSPSYKDLPIEETIIHPAFSPINLNNDIALIRVPKITFNGQNIRPVCLPIGAARTYNFTDRNAVVTGWGVTESYRPSKVLLKAELPVVPLGECQRDYKDLKYKGRGISLDYRQLCAGGRTKSDSCKGDSGGPLHVVVSLNGDTRYVQQGIVSLGPNNCGKTTVPALYTKIAYYMDWILDRIGG